MGGCGARAQRKGEGGEGGKGRVRHAGAKTGTDAARASKKEHGGAVTTIEWWCERPDGGVRWRDDGRERKRSADTVAKMRAADHFWAVVSNTVHPQLIH